MNTNLWKFGAERAPIFTTTTWIKITMSEKFHVLVNGFETVMVYLSACFAGGLGGAAVAANRHIQHRSLMTFSLIALVMVGVFSGLAVASYLLAGYQLFTLHPVTAVASYLLAGYQLFTLHPVTNFHEIVFWSLIGGFGGAIFIGGMNLSAGVIAVFIMRRLGLPVELSEVEDEKPVERKGRRRRDSQQ